jgi:dTDP-glucose 4,6-dehydratase
MKRILITGGSGFTENMIEYVVDRPGHDLRYSIDSSMLEKELKWTPSYTFEAAIDFTVEWYLDKYMK